MTTALDTNILSGLLADIAQSAAIAIHLDRCSRRGSLIISPPVYAETLAHPGITVAFLKPFLAQTRVFVEFTLEESIWTEASTRFAKYASRRRTSSADSPRKLFADFLIGTHTMAKADCLMTYDIRFYQQNFPDIALYPLPAQ
jgi:predicted nucleic acid-binding protein